MRRRSLSKEVLPRIPVFFVSAFVTLATLLEEVQQWTISQGASSAQVPEKIVTCALLQQKNKQTHSRKSPEKGQTRRLSSNLPEY